MSTFTDSDIQTWKNSIAKMPIGWKRKSTEELGFLKSSRFWKSKLIELYESMTTDYHFYFEKCLQHDYEFQGIPYPTSVDDLKHSEKIKVAEEVENASIKIMALLMHAQSMLSRSYFRENIIRFDKRGRIPASEVSDFLIISAENRNHLIFSFKFAFNRSFFYSFFDMFRGTDNSQALINYESLKALWIKHIQMSITAMAEEGIESRDLGELLEAFKVEEMFARYLEILEEIVIDTPGVVTDSTSKLMIGKTELHSDNPEIKICPMCAEKIKFAAKKCRYCQHIIENFA